jgi:NTP pyrophosphatase (non-canonical NTP hydrolase)
MDIRQAIEDIWQNRKYTTDDPKTTLSHLNEEVAESLKALMKGDTDKAKRELQDAMSCLFIAMRVMEIDPVEAVNPYFNLLFYLLQDKNTEIEEKNRIMWHGDA